MIDGLRDLVGRLRGIAQPAVAHPILSEAPQDRGDTPGQRSLHKNGRVSAWPSAEAMTVKHYVQRAAESPDMSALLQRFDAVS